VNVWVAPVGIVVLRMDQLLDDRRHHLDAERQRDDIEQRDVLASAREHVGLDRSTERDDLLGIEVRERVLPNSSAT